MKKYIFIIIGILFLLKPVIPFLEYMVNYEYIANELCENKDKPELKCNGKCHLKKELAKVSEEEKPQSQDKKNQTSEIEVLYFSKVADYTFSPTFGFSQKSINSHYLNLYKGVCTNSTFHPPTLFV
ncbi:hypothetical protein [Flavobacterium sp.]|uniref:hypothetical protein n=1 Tax=Flavobacterium sp. TaxID=239 RepID=UPI0035272B2B